MSFRFLEEALNDVENAQPDDTATETHLFKALGLKGEKWHPIVLSDTPVLHVMYTSSVT